MAERSSYKGDFSQFISQQTPKPELQVPLLQNESYRIRELTEAGRLLFLSAQSSGSAAGAKKASAWFWETGMKGFQTCGRLPLLYEPCVTLDGQEMVVAVPPSVSASLAAGDKLFVVYPTTGEGFWYPAKNLREPNLDRLRSYSSHFRVSGR